MKTTSVVLVAIFLISWVPLASGDDRVLEELLLTLDSHAALAGDTTFEWVYDYKRFSIPDPMKVKSESSFQERLQQRARAPLKEASIDPKFKFHGAARWDHATGRFWIKSAVVDQWAQGKVEYIGFRDEIGFDGEVFWSVETTRPGSELPLTDFTGDRDPEADWLPEGLIDSKAPEGGRLEALIVASGYAFRPGYMAFPEGSPLHESVSIVGFLRELKQRGVDLKVERTEDEIVVRYDMPDSSDASVVRGWAILRFDMQKLGALTQVSFEGASPAGRIRVADFYVTYAKLSTGVWFPEEVIWGNWLNTRVDQIKITDSKIQDNVKREAFQVNFPVGTRVTDHRAKLTYVASPGMVDEDRAVREFAALHLGDFEPLRKLTDSPRRSPWRTVVSVGTILLMIAALCLWYYQSRRGTASMILLVILGGSVARAQEGVSTPNLLRWSDSAGWVVGDDGNTTVAVTSCGLRVASLALCAFERPYSVKTLSRHLQPNSRGISLLALTETMEAFGLVTVRRKDVSWSDLNVMMAPGAIAIAAIPPHRIPGGHYVIVRKTRDNELMVLDPPHTSHQLQVSKEESYTSRELAVVLLLEGQSTAVDVSVPELVVLEPAADSSWRTPIELSIPLRNTGENPIWLSEISPPCGCLKVIRQPNFIAVNSTETIDVRVDPVAFGFGMRRKPLRLDFPGHESAQIVLEGQFTLPEAETGAFQRAPTQIHVPVDLDTGSAFRAKIALDEAETVESLLEVLPGASWCRIDSSDAGDRRSVDVILDGEYLKRVRSGESLVAQIEISRAGQLIGRHPVIVSMGEDALRVDTKRVTGDEGYLISGGLRTDLETEWRVVAFSTHLSAVDVRGWKIDRSGHWNLEVVTGEEITKPTPLRLTFENAGCHPVSTTCILMPLSLD
ncbi:MAG: cysteine peptidase family C39 domain-containing protein [Planctomycetaceae bacterium]